MQNINKALTIIALFSYWLINLPNIIFMIYPVCLSFLTALTGWFIFVTIKKYLLIIENDVEVYPKSGNGEVKIRIGTVMVSVCPNFWTNDDAKVACKQINPNYTGIIIIPNELL